MSPSNFPFPGFPLFSWRRQADKVCLGDWILNSYFQGCPPGPFLHSLLAEKSGARYKQVPKVPLTFRLNRLREIRR
jgi:hypothetical protein